MDILSPIPDVSCREELQKYVSYVTCHGEGNLIVLVQLFYPNAEACSRNHRNDIKVLGEFRFSFTILVRNSAVKLLTSLRTS